VGNSIANFLFHFLLPLASFLVHLIPTPSSYRYSRTSTRSTSFLPTHDIMTSHFFLCGMPAIRIGSREQRALHRRGTPDSLLGTVTSASGTSRRSHRINRDRRDASAESDLTSLSPSPEPEGKPNAVIIRGQKLEPTVVFDTLWRWLAERKAIYDRRRAGVPAPFVPILIITSYALIPVSA
jgi:hypothetical protein